MKDKTRGKKTLQLTGSGGKNKPCRQLILFYIVSVSGSSVLRGQLRGRLQVQHIPRVWVSTSFLCCFGHLSLPRGAQTQLFWYFVLKVTVLLLCVCVSGLINTHSRQVYTCRLYSFPQLGPIQTPVRQPAAPQSRDWLLGAMF